MTPFPTNLKKLREKSGKDMEDIAYQLGYSLHEYRAYESGIAVPGIHFAVKAARYWGLSLDAIVLQEVQP